MTEFKLGDRVWISQTGRGPFVISGYDINRLPYLKHLDGTVPSGITPAGQSYYNGVHPNFLTREEPPSNFNYYISVGYKFLRIFIFILLLILSLCSAVISFIKILL